ncbi:MAG: hypothetical protein IT436_16790 [Phycisphaerales bacterium]|nr:hypothetical protein [Phycisphaerales bacterium]
MAIDPKMYEKYSGRSGDPYKRLGEALAKSSAKKQQVRAQADKSFSERIAIGHFKANWMLSIIGSIIVLIVVIVSLFR